MYVYLFNDFIYLLLLYCCNNYCYIYFIMFYYKSILIY